MEVPDMDKEIKVDGANVKSPELLVEAKLPHPAADVDVKVKKSRFSFPKFSLPKQSSKESEFDVDLPEVDVSVPEGKLEITSPKVEFQPPEVDVNIDGQESKFKMPKFGISMPKVKGPEIDISLSKKEGEIRLPKAEVELTDVHVELPSAQVEIEGPKIEAQPGSVDGSPSKFKLPTFKLPKLGVALPQVSVEVPDMEKGKMEITSPEVECQLPDVDVNVDGQQSKFKVPKFGFSLSNVKEPGIDLSLSKKEADIRLPEDVVEIRDVEIKLPSAKVEIEGPKIEAQPGSVDGSPSKFKLPTFKLPKFGVALPQVSVEVPDMEKGKMEITSPKVEFQPPEVDVSVDGQESKFKMPKFGISMPKVKGPEIDISLSKKEGEIRLPKAEVELTDVHVELPSAQVEIEGPKIEAQPGSVDGSPSKFKLPTFKLPKFGVALPQVSVEVPDMDKEIKVDGANVSVEVPDMEKGKMEITSPKVEFQPPEVDVNVDGQESKFKMPKFGISMPKVKGPEIDTSLSKKEGEIRLPEAEVEIQDVHVELPSAQVEIEGPKIEAQPGSVDGSPSKFKLPTFKLPKFGVALPQQSSKESEFDVDLPDVDVSVPEGKLEITSPKVEFQPPEVDVSVDGQESKFKMPKFGISMPKVKGPEIDTSLSKKEGEIRLPKAEVELTDVHVELPSAQVEIEGPKIEAQPGSVDGSPSKFKLPTFKLPKLGVALPQVSVEVPDMEKGKMEITSPEVECQLPDVDVNVDGQQSKFKVPKFGFSLSNVKEPGIDLSLSKKEADIRLPEDVVEIRDVEIKLPSAKVEIEGPKIEAQPGSLDGSPSKFKLPTITFPKFLLSKQSDAEMNLQSPKEELRGAKIEAKKGGVEGSPSKFKLPSLKLPKFGGSPTKVCVEVPDVEAGSEIDSMKLEIPEDGVKTAVSAPSIDTDDLSAEVKTKGGEIEGPGIQLKPLPDLHAEFKLSDVEVEPLESIISPPEAPKMRKGMKNDSASPVSPSRFKLPSFKMPTLAFSPQKTEGKSGSPETEYQDNQPETKTELNVDGKSPQATSTSFGDVRKNVGVELPTAQRQQADEHPDTSEKEKDTKDKQTKQQATKTPERTGRFPTFGLASPSEPSSTPQKGDEKAQKSPSGESEFDVSPTFSVQSSDIFADISSTMTSEYVSFPSSSPTKVTVKYSDPNLPPKLREMNVVTSTARSELITVEPDLPEKITVLSSEVSSSSEETLRLPSGKIHVFTSSVQSGPESQLTKVLSKVQSTGETSQISSSWTVESSQSSRTLSQKRIVRETSRESTETFVVTKQITKTFEPAEFFADDETASSIQRLRESVRSEKMRFFDGAEK
ncbi:neuroblast differentiation-associated protein AHNAK-like [Syngnathoides biaculeatus]|uniref:neuroblast differentiation-associated protein AHNAK-like n=1 Tax=Syngnathoides biaculeatus TaxID=300417 RepID=UPI002ADDAC42|nr:neuroblast differentiation-associated protein AHNAK-like [Syngnathoides biaculeatus]